MNVNTAFEIAVGWAVGLLVASYFLAIAIGIARFIYAEAFVAPRENRFARDAGEFASKLLQQQSASELYRSINGAGYIPATAREITFGNAFLDVLEPADWRMLEELTAFLMRQAGWDADTTRPTLDDGVDVLGTDDSGRTFVAQVKHQQSSVGRPVIDAIVGAAVSHGATVAIAITSGTFTRQAKAFTPSPSSAIQVQLWDRARLSAAIDDLKPTARDELVTAVTRGRSRNRMSKLLSYGSSMSEIESNLQHAVKVKFSGRLPACWEHNAPMICRLSGDYVPEVWWECPVSHCNRARDPEGTHRYIQVKRNSTKPTRRARRGR